VLHAWYELDLHEIESDEGHDEKCNPKQGEYVECNLEKEVRENR
jgi:hypothetical protein